MFEAKSLPWVCASALGVFAVLGLLGIWIQQGAIADSKGMGAVINESGRQRMLTQLTASLAEQYWLGDASARDELRKAMQAMSDGYKSLSKPYQADAPVGEAHELHQIYFEGTDPVATQEQRFLAAAQKVADGGVQDHATEDAVHALQTQSRSAFRDDLNQIVQIHQRALEERMTRLKQLAWSLWVLMVAVLVVEWLFLFRPMVRQIETLESVLEA